MKCQFELYNPEEAEMTLKVTMRLSSWKRLRMALDQDTTNPAWELKHKIDEIVAEASAVFRPKINSSDA